MSYLYFYLFSKTLYNEAKLIMLINNKCFGFVKLNVYIIDLKLIIPFNIIQGKELTKKFSLVIMKLI